MPLQISAFTALDDLSQLAVGFANGSVTVVRGDLVHDRGAKQRTVYESEEPITGVEFRDESRVITLYVSTTSRILKLVISGKGQGQGARAIEDAGCAVGCMTLDGKTVILLLLGMMLSTTMGLMGEVRGLRMTARKAWYRSLGTILS